MDVANIPFPMVGDGVALAVWLVIGIGIPFLVDLITERRASPRVKATCFMGLQLVNGILSGFLVDRGTGKTFDWNSALWAALITFVIGQSIFKWGKNANILGKYGVVAGALPSGIGKPVQPIEGQVEHMDGTRHEGVLIADADADVQERQEDRLT